MVTISFAQVRGLAATLVHVESDLSPGLHIFSIVGLADKEIQESRERIGAALRNIGARPPHRKSERLIVNLAPADIRKEGPAFDLPIALGYLLASGQMRFNPRGKLFAGELGLDGTIKKITGVLAMAMAAHEANMDTLYVPAGNGAEAALVSGIKIKEAPDLRAIIEDLEERAPLPLVEVPRTHAPPAGEDTIDFSLIHGQDQAKRALEIAAAGGHNVLFSGPPGTGKTLLARAFASILPSMREKEIIEVTNIHSIAGMLPAGGILSMRPFRSPHHNASAVAITGGGSDIRPGEVTLAHRGVLFLDEFPEFASHVLESLRQPLEEKMITVSRASGSQTFPADFMLVAAMNPCPCGNLAHPSISCVCTPGAISKYQRKISGPLMDRIDLTLQIGPVEIEKLTANARDIPLESPLIQKRVEAARAVQRKRFAEGKTMTNAAMGIRDLKRFADLDAEPKRILTEAYERFNLSVRAFYRTVRVARTIADLAGSNAILPAHILESLQYRVRSEI